MIGAGLSDRFSPAGRWLDQQRGDDHEVVGEPRGADEQREALGALGAAALHAATAHQHRDASLDAGAKALALLERRRSFVGLALRRFAAAALGNTYCLDGALHAHRYVLLAEEAAICAVEFRGTAERAPVPPEPCPYMNLLHRLSLHDPLLLA